MATNPGSRSEQTRPAPRSPWGTPCAGVGSHTLCLIPRAHHFDLPPRPNLFVASGLRSPRVNCGIAVPQVGSVGIRENARQPAEPAPIVRLPRFRSWKTELLIHGLSISQTDSYGREAAGGHEPRTASAACKLQPGSRHSHYASWLWRILGRNGRRAGGVPQRAASPTGGRPDGSPATSEDGDGRNRATPPLRLWTAPTRVPPYDRRRRRLTPCRLAVSRQDCSGTPGLQVMSALYQY